jgi:hypothetical protein
MRAKIASFLADNGSVPVLTTTPKQARINDPEGNQTIIGE